jgi:deoxyribonuclease-4
MFSRNPRGWKARPLDAEEIERFGALRLETGVAPVVIHANYLVNLAAADEVVREKSIAAFREEVERGLALGADYLVVHPGSAKGGCERDAIRTCAESLLAACEGLSLGSFRILLENTAGQGACIGHRFEHLREIIEACAVLAPGVCLDTAHAFTAGYDIRDEDGLSATLDALDASVGLENVRAVHFNDSKAAYNSRGSRTPPSCSKPRRTRRATTRATSPCFAPSSKPRTVVPRQPQMKRRYPDETSPRSIRPRPARPLARLQRHG